MLLSQYIADNCYFKEEMNKEDKTLNQSLNIGSEMGAYDHTKSWLAQVDLDPLIKARVKMRNWTRGGMLHTPSFVDFVS